MATTAPTATSTLITVPNPDSHIDPPIYEGPAATAHQHLIPGTYTAITMGDDTEPGDGEYVTLLVTAGASHAIATPQADRDALDAIATVLGTTDDWSDAAETINRILSAVRPPAEDDADTYAAKFTAATGRPVHAGWDSTPC